MTAALDTSSANAVDFINPVITATVNVFNRMLTAEASRTGIKLKDNKKPEHEVSGVIGVTGKVQGTIILSLSKEAALQVLERMIGLEADSINDEVCDAVGELTNMIAGQAKAQLAQLDLSIGIPNVVSGNDHVVHYPSEIEPLCITFESELGPFTIEVGFTNLEL